MSLKDLIADVNVNEICEHIETETLSEWVNAWQEAALSALRPVSREQVEKVWRGKSMENEKLFLALRAGARAIVNNKRLHGALYCWDIWGENGGPKEISYLEAATLLAETADKMEERPPEGEA